mmetsp:Transcript_37234/g.87880  ORF Transcript_37234/g.87880 Transcript_37234/m.87880 type:complete len:200 (-) Transcript_37234:795-1394(-)
MGMSKLMTVRTAGTSNPRAQMSVHTRIELLPSTKSARCCTRASFLRSPCVELCGIPSVSRTLWTKAQLWVVLQKMITFPSPRSRAIAPRKTSRITSCWFVGSTSTNSWLTPSGGLCAPDALATSMSGKLCWMRRCTGRGSEAAAMTTSSCTSLLSSTCSSGINAWPSVWHRIACFWAVTATFSAPRSARTIACTSSSNP